jgi:hypothetical protein
MNTNMALTTISINTNLKATLDQLKCHRAESYNSVIERLADLAYDDSPLSQTEIQGLEEALEEIKNGHYIPQEDLFEQFGLP